MIPLYKVHMPKNIAAVLESVLLSGFISEGPQAKRFEEEFQAYIGNKNTALTNTGTAAITLALKLAGVGPGTSVISSPMTCLATNEPILSLGADIIWCDIDYNTGNINANEIENCIREDTRAIIFVDWGGIPAEIETINEIASRHGIKVIEDAAQALGSSCGGGGVGTKCDFTAFSMQAIKFLTTIDGGAIACKTKEDYDRAVLLRWYGLSRNHSKKSPVCWEGDVFEYGFKAHMNDVNATIGLEQLKYIDYIIEAHKRNGSFLLKELGGINKLEVPIIPDYIEPSFWFFTIKLLDSTHRKEVSEKLIENGIACGITHTRNDKYSLFNNYVKDLPELDKFSDRMLNIPCGWWCSIEDLEHIVETLRRVC